MRVYQWCAMPVRFRHLTAEGAVAERASPSCGRSWPASLAGELRYGFLWANRLHAVSAPVGSIATLPSSMWMILPSLSITKVDRLATPTSGIRTP